MKLGVHSSRIILTRQCVALTYEFVNFHFSGLLSAHILSEYLQKEYSEMTWYRGELLEMAKDLGYRLLPAFNTSTGIPHARVRQGFFSNNFLLDFLHFKDLVLYV